MTRLTEIDNMIGAMTGQLFSSFRAMPFYVQLSTLGLIILGVITTLNLIRNKTYAARKNKGDPKSELLRYCQDDLEKVERLIDYECRRAPQISRRRAEERALESYKRDRR